jgi:periplasmic copper chaperone A
MRTPIAFCGVAAAVLLAVTGAQAHVTLEAKEAVAGSTQKIVLRVPHGCDGKATNTVRVKVPDGMMSVKAQPKAGWTLTLVKAPLANPITDGHGNTVSEGVSEVVWSGGDLPDEFYDEFVLRGTLPKMAGAMLYFPVVQECPEGATARWIEIPTAGQSAHDLKMPAPGLKLTAPAP